MGPRMARRENRDLTRRWEIGRDGRRGSRKKGSDFCWQIILEIFISLSTVAGIRDGSCCLSERKEETTGWLNGEDKIHTHIFATEVNKKLLNHIHSLANEEFELALASKSILFVHFYLISNFSLSLHFTVIHRFRHALICWRLRAVDKRHRACDIRTTLWKTLAWNHRRVVYDARPSSSISTMTMMLEWIRIQLTALPQHLFKAQRQLATSRSPTHSKLWLRDEFVVTHVCRLW